MTPKQILLSPPHLSPLELEFVQEAFNTNWIAPVGPHVDAFEQEFCRTVGSEYAVAVNSGTAALHLALRLIGIEPGDEVLCSTLTFVATANPILYMGARPTFIDSDQTSWNMDPDLLLQAIKQHAAQGNLPKAVMLVHLYGQSADIDPIRLACQQYDIPLIEDAAEALGAVYKGKVPGTFGKIGVYSFNGNKIITTSGGGMLVTDDEVFAAQARFLATQARDTAPHYQHSQMGYNYRLSNVLAGIGRGQLRVLADRVAARRAVFETYRRALGSLPGVTFMPEADFGMSTRWLSCLTLDPDHSGLTPERLRLALAAEQIESRPVWKPLHLQPLFKDCQIWGGEVSEKLFNLGLCLPSGSSLTEDDCARVIEVIQRQFQLASVL